MMFGGFFVSKICGLSTLSFFVVFFYDFIDPILAVNDTIKPVFYKI